MSTDADTEAEGTARGRGRTRGSWTVPVGAIIVGGVFLAIGLAHHDVGSAVFGLVIMVAYAAVLVLGSRRSEAVSMLRGESGDERRRSIEQEAAAVTFYVLTLVLVGGYLVSLIRGSGEGTWSTLCAVLGGVYILSTVILAKRG